jgi:hypothetical protein
MRTIAPTVLLLLLAACTPPVEAPEEFGDLTRFLFASFASETDAELAAGVPGLESYLAEVELGEGPRDRAVTLPPLTSEFLEDLTRPPDTDPANQVPVGLASQSEHDLAAAVDLITDPNQVCIANNSYKYYRRDFSSDPACFRDGSCSSLAALAEIRYESFLANIWYDEHQRWRRVELDDGRTAIFQRAHTDRVFASDNEGATWDQRYALNVWLPQADDGSKTWRFLAFWSEANIPAIGDDAYANLVADGIDEGYVNEEAFAAEEACDNDRDHEPERPQ